MQRRAESKKSVVSTAKPVKLTDRLLADLYYELNKTYNTSFDAKADPSNTAARILQELDWNLRPASATDPVNTNETLRQLSPEDQEKVKVFTTTFLESRIKEINIKEFYKRRDYSSIAMRATRPYCYHDRVYMYTYSDLRTHHHHVHHSEASSCCNFSSCFGLFNKSDNKDSKEGLAQLAILILLVAAVLAALWAIYYLFQQCANNLEHIFRNEGLMKGLINTFSTVIIGGTTNILLEIYAAPSLMALALAANVANPFALVGFFIGAGTLIGAGLGSLVMKLVTTHTDKDALVPKYPDIFSLSARQERNLLDKGIDPIKVKCAGVAIMASIGNEEIENVLSRSSHASAMLSTWRKIRRGELATVVIDENTYSLNSDAPKANTLLQTAPPAYGSFMSQPVAPSAPPEYEAPPAYNPEAETKTVYAM